MKNRILPILCIMTAMFASFLFGLFFGRAYASPPLQITGIEAIAPAKGTDGTLPEQEETETVHFPLDINSATARELAALPGIGETLAQRIVEYRDANGYFTAPEDLMEVQGIGKARYDALKDYIMIGG